MTQATNTYLERKSVIIHDLNVVWHDVAGYYRPIELKPEKKHNLNRTNEEETKFLKMNYGSINENYVKTRGKHGPQNSRIKIKATEKRISVTNKRNQRKSQTDKNRISSVLHFNPQLISTSKEAPSDSMNFETNSIKSDIEESFNSSYLEYHQMSLIDRKSDVVSSISTNLCKNNEVILSRENIITLALKKILPDMSDTVSAEKLMKMYVKEFYLKIPFLKEELECQEIYEAVMKNNNLINRILKSKKSIFPNDLQADMQRSNRKVSKIMSHGPTELNNERDLFFYGSLTKNFSNIMDEISDDIKEINVFYYPLFKTYFDLVQPLDYLVEFEDEVLLKREIFQLGLELKSNINKPASLVRWKVMEFICSCDYNCILTKLLVKSYNNWLNYLLKSMFSDFSSIRQETCIALAYLITRHTITNELINSPLHDISYDLFVAIFRVFEIFPSNISEYYCLMGFILQKSTNIEILDFILDRGPLVTNIFMKKRWPKLLYYALKYWPHNHLRDNPAIFRKIIECLQIMVFRPVTKRAARQTLLFLCRKFLMKTKLFTIWFDVDMSDGKLYSFDSAKSHI